MKRNFKLIAAPILSFILLLHTFRGAAQEINCPPNLDFEFGSLTNWTCQISDNTGGNVVGVPTTPVTTPGPIFGRHDITTGAGLDPYGSFPVVAPLGGAFSLKLGNDIRNDSAERIRYYMHIPSDIKDYSLTYKYAVILEDGGHVPATDQPRFVINIFDSATGEPVPCAQKTYVAAAGVPGFFNSPIGFDVRVLPWTTAILSLRGQQGKTVVIDVATADCSQSGHFGYGYFDVIECGRFKVVIDSCNLDNKGVVLTGPEGYMTYEWWDSSYHELLDTGRFAAFHPIDTIPQKYALILTPHPSISTCKDTIFTQPLANISIYSKPDTNCVPTGISLQLDANARGGAGPFSYAWSESNSSNTLSCHNCATPIASIEATNFYAVKVTDTNLCYRTDTVSVRVSVDSIRTIPDFVFCHPGYTTLDVFPYGTPPRTPVSCGVDNDITCASLTAVQVRTLYRDLGPRVDTSSIVSPFAAQNSSGHTQFLLKKSDMYAYGMRYGKITSLAFEVVDAGAANFDNFTISLGCTSVSSLGPGLLTGTNVVYTAPAAINPVNGLNNFTLDKAYSWDTSKNLLIDICFSNPVTSTPPLLSIVNTGSIDMVSEYTVTNGKSVCRGDVPEGFAFYAGRPIVHINYCKSPDAPFAYTWYPGVYLSDSTIKTPLAYIPETAKYYVKAIDGNDCYLRDSVTITVPIHDYEIFPKDTSVCLGQPFRLTAAGTFSSVRWFEYDPLANTFNTPTTLNCTDCPNPNSTVNPIATPTDTTTYAVEYTDKDGCNDTLYMNVIVRPLPPVNIINNDTTIKYGQDIMLVVSGAYLYTWSPTGSLSNPNVVNPVASPNDPTLYYVYGIGENGCRNTDSVMVNIDYRSNLFVPTAFTPNGDGKNDIFKVSNITFQRLQEFRVFNRWGQEIFSTNDIKSGWNGSWKGQPQDMGVYQYVIKVAYPDGIIETYKGNITLVR